jgi:hypothetical protein
MAAIGLAVFVAALPLVAAYLLWRNASRTRLIPSRPPFLMAVMGSLMGVLASYLEHWALDFMELSFVAAQTGENGALAAMLLMAAPVEEGLKALLVWPLYVKRQILSSRLGMIFALSAGAGFAGGEAFALLVQHPPEALFTVRVMLSLPAHLFFAGLWGFALGSRRGRDRWFPLAWSCSVLLHGLYAHIVIGRGPALLVAVVPVLLLMAIASVLVVRALNQARTSSSSASSKMAEQPAASMASMRAALQRPERPLMVHWIALGALVTLGLVIVALATAVYLGHRLGIDFTLANESNLRSMGPLALLGSFVLMAFPCSGYLVARASAAQSVLEPAMASGLALLLVMLMLSVTEPLALVVAVAVAPVAFALACGGAWFALDRT